MRQPAVLASINSQDEKGMSALWYACEKGHGGVVGGLVGAGTDPLLANQRRRAPLDVARQKHCLACVGPLKVRGGPDE